MSFGECQYKGYLGTMKGEHRGPMYAQIGTHVHYFYEQN